MFSSSFFILSLPAGSKIEDLLALASQDIEPATDKLMEDKGTSLLREHQELMLQYYGNTDTAILPDHVVQHMLLGVSIPYNLSYFLFSLLALGLKSCTQNELFVFQSTRTLELALIMEVWVIQLKQDALRLFNVTVAGCACGA